MFNKTSVHLEILNWPFLAILGLFSWVRWDRERERESNGSSILMQMYSFFEVCSWAENDANSTFNIPMHPKFDSKSLNLSKSRSTNRQTRNLYSKSYFHCCRLYKLSQIFSLDAWLATEFELFLIVWYDLHKRSSKRIREKISTYVHT